MNKKICRKCLIPDYVQDKESFLETYLGQIDGDNKINDEEYDRRLEKCGGCKNYINGMCRLCGCFVAVRAAVKQQYCPDEPSRWQI